LTISRQTKLAFHHAWYMRLPHRQTTWLASASFRLQSLLPVWTSIYQETSLWYLTCKKPNFLRHNL